jgi:hypothetical protein
MLAGPIDFLVASQHSAGGIAGGLNVGAQASRAGGFRDVSLKSNNETIEPESRLHQ